MRVETDPESETGSETATGRRIDQRAFHCRNKNECWRPKRIGKGAEASSKHGISNAAVDPSTLPVHILLNYHCGQLFGGRI